jgi:hypothetical protein
MSVPGCVHWLLCHAALTVGGADCGSCYAFASTETLESISYLKTGLLMYGIARSYHAQLIGGEGGVGWGR